MLRRISIITAVWMLSALNPAAAVEYQVTAIGATTPSGNDGTNSVTTSNWTLVFDDTSGDGLLQADEIVSFSGTEVTTRFLDPLTGALIISTYQYDAIVGTPAIAGISTESGTIGPCCWWFTGPVMADTGTIGADGWFPRRWPDYSIEVYVRTPEAIIGDLIASILAMNIKAGLSNALDSKLQNVLAALDQARADDNASAIGMLHAFIQSVEAQRGKAILDTDADELIAQAMAVIGLLENP